MRVLTVGSRFPPDGGGGYERLWTAAREALGSAGHEVQVLTTRAPGAPPQAGVRRELDWYWRDDAFPARTVASVVRTERANAAAWDRVVATFAPDRVLWLAMGGMSLSLLGRARAQGLAAVAVIADDWLNYGPRVDGLTRRLPGPLRRPGGTLLSRALALGAGPHLAGGPGLRVSFISAYLRDTARAGGAWAGPAFIDHPGVDSTRFAGARPAETWRGRLLYCGRLDPRKGVATAIAALARLPDAVLTVDGDGTPAERERLRAVAARHEVADRVIWRVSAPDRVHAAYADADAVLFPVTWPEPWGLVPLEAMATGRPVVVSAAGGGIGEYVRDGNNALVVAPEDPGSLAAAVMRLAADPGLRERLVSGGRSTTAALTEAAWCEAVVAHLSAVAR